jgi:NAD+ diphosphatase
VVIMLGEHDGMALLGRQHAWPEGRYSALAGFVEPGESFEEAVTRELFEEAGVRTTAVHYVASQPWPFPSSLMIACTAALSGNAITLDTAELEDAIWVSRADVRAALAGNPAAPFIAPPEFAIAHHLLVHWADVHWAAASDQP